MKNLISDKQFCNEITLSGKAGRMFRELLRKRRFKQAATFAAKEAFNKPFRHPIKEDEIPAIAKLIGKEIPDQIRRMEELADNYWLKKPQPVPKNCSAYDLYHFHVPNTTQRQRGIAVYSLCRLSHLTGRKKYFTGAMKMMHELCSAHGDYPAGKPIGVYGWHPHTAKQSFSHTIAHMGQEFNMMLPFIRTQISADDRLYLLKVLWTIADLAYRGFEHDQSFNLTLHFLTSCHQTALIFPQFKQSKAWRTWATHGLKEFYDSHGVTSDGYFREGVLYQRVNHHLLELNMMFLQAAGEDVPAAMKKTVHAAHKLNAAICGPDGFPPLIGDSAATNPHEHWIHTHESLHLAAALENKKSYKQQAGTPHYDKVHERNCWDMGLKGFKRYLKMPSLEQHRRMQKPHDHGKSGWQILGAGTGAQRNFGALIYTQNHNHAHFDIGSLHLYSHGRTLINDSSKSSYGTPDSKDELPHAHNMVILPRFSPAGPRLHTDKWAKTKFSVHKRTWQAASMQHCLYDGFLVQRTLVFIKRIDRTADRSFWLVFDRITPEQKHPLGLHELVDTYFQMNAVESTLGINGLQCWSRHNSKLKTAHRYAETDTFFKGPTQPFDIRECRQTFEFSDSPANILIAAACNKDAEFSLQEEVAHTCEFGGRVKRPAALYKYRGPLPASFAYVLAPFDGLKQKPPVTITTRWKGKSFSCDLDGQRFRISNPFTGQITVRS